MSERSSRPVVSDAAPKGAPLRLPVRSKRPLQELARSAPRRMKQYFSAERVLDVLKTLAWVAPLTVLVWVYAEREQLARPTNVSIPIEVRSTAPNRIVRLLGDKNVMVDLEGPRRNVDALIDALSKPTSDLDRLQIDLDASLTPNRRHEISSLPLIANQPLFKRNAITVLACRPPRLTVYVDEVVEADLPLKLPDSITNLESPPAFDPQTVHYRGPKSALDAAREAAGNNPLMIEANLSGRESLKTPGHHVEKNVPLRSPFNKEDGVVLTPSTVDVTLDLRAADEEWTYPSMPIVVEAPPSLWDDFKIVYDGPSGPTLANVVLIGPPKLHEAMMDPQYAPKPYARLKVTSDDATGNRISRLPEFVLPKDVKVKDPTRAIEFRLVPREPQ